MSQLPQTAPIDAEEILRGLLNTGGSAPAYGSVSPLPQDVGPEEQLSWLKTQRAALVTELQAPGLSDEARVARERQLNTLNSQIASLEFQIRSSGRADASAARAAEPSLAEVKDTRLQGARSRYLGDTRAGIPTHYINELGVESKLTQAQVTLYRPEFIRQTLQELSWERDDQGNALGWALDRMEVLEGELEGAEMASAFVGKFGRLPTPTEAAKYGIKGFELPGQAPGMPYLGGGGSGASNRVQFGSEVALDEAQAGYYKAQTEKLQREAIPEYQKLMQDRITTIAEIRGMIERGDMTPEEGDTYMTAFDEYIKAQLKGATPFQIKQNEQQETRQRAEIGKDILNQRMQSAGAVANTLISGFHQSLPYLGAGVAPGQTVNFDPFAMAGQFVNQTGGGPEMGELAQGLVKGLQPGGAPAGPNLSDPANNPLLQQMIQGGAPGGAAGPGAAVGSLVAPSVGGIPPDVLQQLLMGMGR